MIEIEKLIGAPSTDANDFRGVVLKHIGDRSYLDVTEDGLSLVVDDGRIIAAHLYSGGKEGFARFRFEVPLGASFDMSRDELRAHLGPPDSFRDAGQVPMIGDRSAWDRFTRNRIALRAEYTHTLHSVQMFTVMPI